MFTKASVLVKQSLVPLLYRYPPFGLQPTELAIYLNCLLEKSGIVGDVAEVGCSVGGTAAIAYQIVKKHSPEKRYVCFDTFSGFVEKQFAADVERGTPTLSRKAFASNSKALVRRILDHHGAQAVELVQGDITAIDDLQLSAAYSMVLCDVDLSEPTYSALKRFHPRLSKGGIILIDDCSQAPEQRWRAADGYKKYCVENGIAERYLYGFGVIEVK